MSFLELVNGLAKAGDPHQLARTWHEYTAEVADLAAQTSVARDALHTGTPEETIASANTGVEERAMAAAALLRRNRG